MEVISRDLDKKRGFRKRTDAKNGYRCKNKKKKEEEQCIRRKWIRTGSRGGK
jgi:hypothetical protein